MKQPRDSYLQAFVPDHLTKLTIDKLPYDTPYCVSPGERDDYEPTALFVDQDRELRMSRSFAIDASDDSPRGLELLGLVGVMRSAVIDPKAKAKDKNSVRDVYVADLRFIEAHTLVDSDESSASIADQEEYMHYVNELENSIKFDGFIAAEQELMENDEIPRGDFYGSEAVHPMLDILAKRSKKLAKHALRQLKVENAEEIEKADAKSEKEKKKQDQPK